MHISINSAHSVQNPKSLHTQTWFIPIALSVVVSAPLLSWTFLPKEGISANDLHNTIWVLWRSWHPLNTLYGPFKVTLANGNITITNKTIAGNERLKNRTYDVLGI